MSNKIFQNYYELLKKIGSGSFGDVYMCKDIEKDVIMASKVEDLKGSSTKLELERKLYGRLHKSKNEYVPKIYNFIKTKKYHIMNMELLGKSLDKIFYDNNNKFDIGTVLKLGIEFVNILESLHECNIIHRDIKPNNFMAGLDDEKKVYIMDFGLAKIFIKNNKHISYKTDKNIVGTARYISTNIHLGLEPSRRDDLESIAYMLIYFLKGRLPWQGLKKSEKCSKTSQIDKIKEVKTSTSVEKLCENIPDCFCNFLKIIKNLEFYEKPNYDELRNILLNESINNNIELKYCWI